MARATFSAEPTAVAPHLARTFEKVISTMMNRLSEPNDRIVDEVGAVPLAFAHSPEYPVSEYSTHLTYCSRAVVRRVRPWGLPGGTDESTFGRMNGADHLTTAPTLHCTVRNGFCCLSRPTGSCLRLPKIRPSACVSCCPSCASCRKPRCRRSECAQRSSGGCAWPRRSRGSSASRAQPAVRASALAAATVSKAFAVVTADSCR